MARDSICARGFFRVAIGEERDGRQVVVADSGWKKNTVTNDGLNNYIAGACGAATGSKQVSHLQLGHQTNAVNATQQALSTEFNHGTLIRNSVDRSTIATGTFQATATFSSALLTASTSLGAAALYNTSSSGSMVAGQSFTSSQWNTNQNVSATYQLRFS